MTPIELKTLRESLNLTQLAFTERYLTHFGRGLTALRNWEQGRYPIPDYIVKYLLKIKIPTIPQNTP